MAKDVNINIKAKGGQQVKRQMDDVGRSTQKAGENIEGASRKSQKLGGILSGLSSKILGFVGAWAGLSAVVNILQGIIDKLSTIQQKQKEIRASNATFLGVGQAFEVQTGTVGQQQVWAQFAARLAKAGGFASAGTAEGMGIAMDIALSSRGGLKNQSVQQLALQLAPTFGSANLSGGEIAQFFEFSGKMGLPQTQQGYQGAFSQLMAAFRASNATSFGTFMSSLQTGATGYISQGGTPQFGMSLFAATRAVTANENLAATLLEQSSRLTGGAYARPREAVEKFAGVRFSDLTMDERMEALMAYASSIPESERVQRLTEEGFPAELSTGVAKLVSPVGQKALRKARAEVSAATVESVRAQSRAYLESPLGKRRTIAADVSLRKIKAGAGFEAWQQRMDRVFGEFDILLAEGRDEYFVADEYEPYAMAFAEMESEIKEMQERFRDVDTPEAREALEKLHNLRLRVSGSRSILRDIGPLFLPGFMQTQQAVHIRRGQQYTEELQEIATGAPSVTNFNYNYNTNHNYNPIGGNRRESRTDGLQPSQ